MDTEKRILELNASDFDDIGALSFSDTYEQAIKAKGFNLKEFDIVRLKTDLAVKEYTNEKELISIIPFFVDVRTTLPPKEQQPLKEYTIPTGATIRIYKLDSGFLYNISLPEANITFSELIDMKSHLESFKETGETQNSFIARWYLGYGILEHLLVDPKILEVNINPPGYKTAIRIVHADFDECVSNIYPSEDFLNFLATRLKISTGRPFNKAQPQLDGEISVGNVNARVAAIIDPFSIFGTGYSIRKHREEPWTLPLFLKNNMVNSWFSGLMSLMISHGRTFLTAGPRGSGKTSLLGALLLEILPKYRIITIEDTQELPIYSYKNLGYDILPLKVRSALLADSMEIPFDTGLRTSLRLGDSCLIVGEIRSKEAKVLYEAMRVGAMANVVAGTIHGDSPYGVYERVVNDLEVPKGSFKVTDLIIIVNQIKNAAGTHRDRRVISVTEVLKNWKDEPQFQDLLVYNPNTDQLEPTPALLQGKSVVITQILERTKGYKTYQRVLQDIQLRAWAKEIQVKFATDLQLEAPFVSKVNVLYANLFAKHNPLDSQQQMDAFSKEFLEKITQLYGSKNTPQKTNIVEPTQPVKKETQQKPLIPQMSKYIMHNQHHLRNPQHEQHMKHQAGHLATHLHPAHQYLSQVSAQQSTHPAQHLQTQISHIQPSSNQESQTQPQKQMSFAQPPLPKTIEKPIPKLAINSTQNPLQKPIQKRS
jgi:type IV secretory pathway ATPase VirB11/archaellum biosynthesis ATPase